MSVYDMAINNVRIVTSEEIYRGNIGINKGKIACIDKEKALDGKEMIEGEDQLLFPGIVDNHVHMNDPGYTWREDFSKGTKAAAIGGVTTIVDMPMQNKPALSDVIIAKKKAKIVKDKSYIDYSFWGALVDYNFDQLQALKEWGIQGFKSFMSPVGDDYTSLKTGKIRNALALLKQIGGFAGFHCEDYDIIAYEEAKAIKEGRTTMNDYLKARPVVAEWLSTQSVLALAKEQDAKVHICHVSHGSVCEIILEAKKSKVQVTAETCPHYLIFNENDVIEKGNWYKCSPPIREEANRNALWQAIENKTLDCIVSDHSPAREDEKDDSLNAFQAWGGISGVQTGLQTIFSEGVTNRGLSPTFIARTMSQRPAEIFGLIGKGQILEGYDADFVMVNSDKEWQITEENLEYLNKHSAFCGLKGKGLPVMTVLRGQVIVNQGKVIAEPGYGKLLRA